MSRPLYGAIEAGGTKFVCAAGHGPAELLPDARVQIPTSSPAATLRAVAAFFEQVCQERGPLSGIGIAAFGPVDLDGRSPGWGRILATPKPGWSGTSLTQPLQHFGCPIAIDTDVNAAALAESHMGAGMGLRSVAYVTVGTGIGGGIVIEGRSVRGMLHPEMGHILVRRDPRDAEFGGICPFHRDCLEGLASGPALRARWRDPVADWPQGHPGFEIVGGYLGQLAATVALMISCERIIFGGGVMASGQLLPFVRLAVECQLNGYLPVPARAGGFERYIAAAALGNLAGLTGAMLLASTVAPGG